MDGTAFKEVLISDKPVVVPGRQLEPLLRQGTRHLRGAAGRVCWI